MMKRILFSFHVGNKLFQISIRNFIRIIWFGLVGTLTLLLFNSYQVKGIGEDALLTDHEVLVAEDKNYFLFSPAKADSSIAFIFYTGALVAPEAYAPMAKAIAKRGITVFIVKMPFRMASFGYQKGKSIIETRNFKKWVIGGHSLGAAKAALLVRENPDLFDGLLLIGTTHPKDFNLSHLVIPAEKIYATLDGIAPTYKVENNKHLLPAHTTWIRIEGGNHSQFGYYGFQFRDNQALITREAQQKILTDAIYEFINNIAAS
jgi:predicted esterase